MGRDANVQIGINVPDFVGNKDVYDSLDKAVVHLEKNHIEVHDLAVDGLTEPPSLECTSDDPSNHQGDTCPIHEDDDIEMTDIHTDDPEE